MVKTNLSCLKGLQISMGSKKKKKRKAIWLKNSGQTYRSVCLFWLCICAFTLSRKSWPHAVNDMLECQSRGRYCSLPNLQWCTNINIIILTLDAVSSKTHCRYWNILDDGRLQWFSRSQTGGLSGKHPVFLFLTAVFWTSCRQDSAD